MSFRPQCNFLGQKDIPFQSDSNSSNQDLSSPSLRYRVPPSVSFLGMQHKSSPHPPASAASPMRTIFAFKLSVGKHWVANYDNLGLLEV